MANPTTSGPSSLSTSGSTPLQIIPNQVGKQFQFGGIVNSGAAEGSYSVDDQVTWDCLPPGIGFPLPGGPYSTGIWVKGAGVTGVSARLWTGNVA